MTPGEQVWMTSQSNESQITPRYIQVPNADADVGAALEARTSSDEDNSGLGCEGV
jgi:hypothetical protein